MEELDLGQTIRGFGAGQKVFGRYVLQSILGRGGMGVVWRAYDEQLECEVALKFLPEMVAFDEQAITDLKRETKKTRDLRHHHIVQVYDFVTDKQAACISMEYVDGLTLSAIKARDPRGHLEVDEVRTWVEQLCEALSYAHQRARVVHRDLKPANLMVNSKGELKVTDFGIARSLSDSVSMATMGGRGTSGTLPYMSPQQLDGERASAADDIYSVGATIYELLTSKPPFYSGAVDRQIQEKIAPLMSIRREDLGIVSSVSIPKHWEECVADCMAKDPTRRPPSVAALAERLRGVVTVPVPVVVQPLPGPQRVVTMPASSPPSGVELQRKPGLNRVYAGAAAAGVLLLGGAAIFFGVRSREKPATSPDQTLRLVTSAQVGNSPVSTPAAVAPSTSPSVIAEAENEYEAGFTYYRGGGDVLIDHNKAFAHFSRAADLGLPEAQARLSELLRQRYLDFLRAADPNKAEEWAKKALAGGLETKAEAKNHRAEFELGTLYQCGSGVPQSHEKAIQLFDRAAAGGDSDAKRALGFIYLAGHGVTKNLRTAEKYFQEAAAARNVFAQLWLGMIYQGQDKDQDVPISHSKAAEMYQKAADQNLRTAYERLGNCYEKGEGVPQSQAKAVELYQKAADRGLWSAQMKLGGLYERGEGVPKDLVKAAELYRKVTEQGIKAGDEALKRLEPAGSR